MTENQLKRIRLLSPNKFDQLRSLESMITKLESQRQDEEKNIAKDVNFFTSKLRLLLDGDETCLLDLEEHKLQDFSEIMNVFAEKGHVHQVDGMKYLGINRKKIKFDEKAYYKHPTDKEQICSSSALLNLATKVVDGSSFSKILKPPTPNDMQVYQMACLEKFMERYRDFYKEATRETE